MRLSICDSDNEKDDADPAIDGDCGVFTDGATPEGRILRVVRSIISDLDVPRHLQKPFTPILGETARHELRLVDGGLDQRARLAGYEDRDARRRF